MQTRLFAIAVVLFTASVVVTAQLGQVAGDEPRYRVRVSGTDADALRAALERAGYDVLGKDERRSTVDVAASVDELHALRRDGFDIADIEQSAPLEQILVRKPARRAAATGELSADAAATTGYRDLAGVLARMQEIADANPEIAQVVDITTTYNTSATFEGRHFFALKISDNVSVDEDEPAMLIVANHHAREIVTPVIALEAAERFTSGYGVDGRITSAVDGHEIWIAPVWNPDGYNYVFTTNNMWRKNRRVFSTGVGVDQNRNYPQGWSSACAGSTSPTSDTYKGPSAASEAETRAIMAWSDRERFAKVIDYHSSGREVLYGYRCLSHPFTSWFRQEAIALSHASGYGGLARVPSAEGEHPEWQFAKLGAYAFLIETHTEFQPTYASALAEAAMVWPGILAVLDRPLSISGHVTDAATGAPLSARIDVLNVSFPNGETNSSGGAFGAYHVFLPTGTYDLRFSKDGYGPVVRRVTVGASSAEVVDVQMTTTSVVFSDDFETSRGWTTNSSGTDTATSGAWERGDPQSTSSSGLKQLGTTVSGVNDLVTGRLSGVSAGVSDIDGGRTTVLSPAIALPPTGTLTMTFSYYLAHGSNSSSADYLRVTIIGASGSTTVLEERGEANNDDAAWALATVDLTAFAGQTIRILIEAADAGGASLVEAAIDDVKIVRQ
jgi:carboxypeptidase T